MIGAHTDSPNLRIKPRPDGWAAGAHLVSTEPYGGALLTSWLDLDLGWSGRVVVRGADGPEVRLVRDDEATMRLPRLAIHLDRDVNERGLVVDRQRGLRALWGLGRPPAEGEAGVVAKPDGVDEPRLRFSILFGGFLDEVGVLPEGERPRFLEVDKGRRRRPWLVARVPRDRDRAEPEPKFEVPLLKGRPAVGEDLQHAPRRREERKHVLKYDDVLDGQRRAFYGARQLLLAGDDIHEQVRTMIGHALHDVVMRARRHPGEDENSATPLFDQLTELYPISVDRAEVDRVATSRHGWHDLVDLLVDDTDRILAALEREWGRDELIGFERRVALSVVDRRWQDHLYELEALRDAVQWRASAGRDPLVEFTAGATHRFKHMSKDIEAEVTEIVLTGPARGRHRKADDAG